MFNLSLLRTVWKLGLRNCVRVGAYRLRSRIGAYRLSTPIKELPTIGSELQRAKRISSPPAIRNDLDLIRAAERITEGEIVFFGCHSWTVGSPPDWFRDPWTGHSWNGGQAHWSSIGEFSVAGADIKAIWELSRFEWAVVLSRAFSLTGNNKFLQTYCLWLDDWIIRNPSNAGANWKCGQEASIRLLRFLETLQSLDWPPSALPAIQEFAVAHLRRIAATLQYAVAQDNNHGTSEAAAMFVGGHWLQSVAADRSQKKIAISIAQRGQQRLVERIERLVSSDGSFSQHSVNYHRVLLDTVALVEVWSRRFGVPSPLRECSTRLNAAIEWLAALVEPTTGNAPNLGANDGTALLTSSISAFRDHRPTLQLVSCLLQGRRRYGSGPWDDASRYWGIEPEDYPLVPTARKSSLALPGGTALLVRAGQVAWGMLRVPSYLFRPSQADALHLDLWAQGENLVRDTGTYSYNSNGDCYEYFSGTRGHSTCEFDRRDQMPRLGKFLFSNWLSCEELFIADGRDPSNGIVAAYTDYMGARHRRYVQLLESGWLIEDEVSGFRDCAVIRWHLVPVGWSLSGRQLVSDRAIIQVSGTGDFKMRLIDGWESREYMARAPVSVLEVEVRPPHGRIRTMITVVH